MSFLVCRVVTGPRQALSGVHIIATITAKGQVLSFQSVTNLDGAIIEWYPFPLLGRRGAVDSHPIDIDVNAHLSLVYVLPRRENEGNRIIIRVEMGLDDYDIDHIITLQLNGSNVEVNHSHNTSLIDTRIIYI